MSLFNIFPIDGHLDYFQFFVHSPTAGLCCFCEHVGGFHSREVLDQRVWIFKHLSDLSSCPPKPGPVDMLTISMNIVFWCQLQGRDQYPSTCGFCQSCEGNLLVVIGTANAYDRLTLERYILVQIFNFLQSIYPFSPGILCPAWKALSSSMFLVLLWFS